MPKTLITDDFADDEWLEADDLALLRSVVHDIALKAVRKAMAASEPTPEPVDMTILYVVDCPADFPRVWIRNDRKRNIFGDSQSLRRWQREGDDSWYSWEYVLRVTKSYLVRTLIIGGSA
jgi:hypothetical protein